MLFSLSIWLKDKQIVTKVARHPGVGIVEMGV